MKAKKVIMHSSSDSAQLKTGYIWLIIMVILNVGAGLVLIVAPAKIPEWAIRGVGLIWILEGVSYACDIWLKYLEDKITLRREYET